MKNKYIFTYILLNIFLLVNAQTIKVTYKETFFDNETWTKEFKESTAKLPAYVQEIVKKTIEKKINASYILICNKTKSLYELSNKLSETENITSAYNTNKIYFKDLANKTKIFKSEETGTPTIVEVDFEQYKWEITTETKLINGYKCFKAKTNIRSISKFDNKEVIKNRVVWFTPEIPLSFGPEGFDGLPGLVLETSENDKFYMVATKIEFDTKKEIEIEKPKSNKTISEKEFNEIVGINFEKKLDEN
jgi:GLPGLI family protein